MPQPVYLICSQSNAIDQATNMISFFNVIETIHIKEVPEEAKTESDNRRLFSMRIVSVWMRTEDDKPDQQFEVEFTVRWQLGDKPPESHVITPVTPFAFTTLFHRFTSNDIAIWQFPGPGLMWIECHVRRAGETEWLARQEFPLLLEAKPVTPTEAGTPPTTDGSSV
jgi:hypothetical protein